MERPDADAIVPNWSRPLSDLSSRGCQDISVHLIDEYSRSRQYSIYNFIDRLRQLHRILARQFGRIEPALLYFPRQILLP